MKSLEERKADRTKRHEASRSPLGATRDDLQAAAEAMVASKDKEAGVTSAPLASKAAKKVAAKATVKSPFAAE